MSRRNEKWVEWFTQRGLCGTGLVLPRTCDPSYPSPVEITSQQLSLAKALQTKVFWGPAWVDGVLGRLVLMPDGTTLAQRWGSDDGWSPDERPTVGDLLRYGVPASTEQLAELGVVAAITARLND